MAAYGIFAPVDRSRMIYTTPAAPPRAAAPAPRIAPPTTQPAPIPPRIISTRPPIPTPLPTIPGPTDIGGSVPTDGGSIPAGGGTTGGGTTGGTTSGGGGGGETDTRRLLDMIAGAFQPQEVSPSLAPQSFETTSSAEPTSGTNPLALLIVAIAVIGGIYWYSKRKKKAAA